MSTSGRVSRSSSPNNLEEPENQSLENLESNGGNAFLARDINPLINQSNQERLRAGFENNGIKGFNYGRKNTSQETLQGSWQWLLAQTSNMEHRFLGRLRDSSEYITVKDTLSKLSSNIDESHLRSLNRACADYINKKLESHQKRHTSTGQFRLDWVYFMWEKTSELLAESSSSIAQPEPISSSTPNAILPINLSQSSPTSNIQPKPQVLSSTDYEMFDTPPCDSNDIWVYECYLFELCQDDPLELCIEEDNVYKIEPHSDLIDKYLRMPDGTVFWVHWVERESYVVRGSDLLLELHFPYGANGLSLDATMCHPIYDILHCYTVIDESKPIIHNGKGLRKSDGSYGDFVGFITFV